MSSILLLHAFIGLGISAIIESVKSKWTKIYFEKFMEIQKYIPIFCIDDILAMQY